MIKDNRNNEQIYGRNDMIMLDPNNKIYGSLGLADNYVMKTEEGTSLILNNPKPGSFGDVLTEFNIYGRSEQKSTTGAQLANLPNKTNVVINGVTWSCKDNVVTAIGETADKVSNTMNSISCYIPVVPGNYHVSDADTIVITVRVLDAVGTYKYYTNNKSFSLTGDEREMILYFQIFPNLTINNTIKVMLNKGDTSLPFEPYTGGIPSPSPEYPQEIKSVVNPTVKVTSEDGLKVQSVTLNNITLNAIPVSSGGNVIIDGQQYIADYVDVERRKLVRLCYLYKFDMDDYVGTLPDETMQDARFVFTLRNASKEQFTRIGLSNIGYKYYQDIDGSAYPYGVCITSINEVRIRVKGVTNKSELAEYLASNNVFLLYTLQTQIEEEFTTEQAQAFKELVTYYPITIVENNYNTWMKATYKSIESV